MVKMWSLLKALEIKDAKSKEEPLACRACLATDVVLYNILENNLAEHYKLINGITISLQDRYPKHLCCYCAAFLQKCVSFRKRCIKAYNLLMNINPNGKSMTTKNIQNLQKTNKDLQLPYSFSRIDIEEIRSEQVVDNDDNDLTTNIDGNNDTNDDFDQTNDDDDTNVNDVDTNNADDENTEINMTIGDVIDLDDDEFEIIEKKWTNGEYKIENLKTDVDIALYALRQAGVVDDDDGWDQGETGIDKDKRKERVFEGIPRHQEHRNLTDNDKITLAEKYSFNVLFPDEEKQREIVEAMKQRSGSVCRLCGVFCRTKWRLAEHTRGFHNPASKFSCKICQARFHTISRQLDHMQQHRVLYQCGQCEFHTWRLFDLPQHQARHNNHRFICDSCGKPFVTIGAMQKHIRSWHTVAKPWCDICGLAFVNQTGLDTHIRLIHKDKMVSCDKCGAEFLSDVALDRHGGYECGAWDCRNCGSVLGSGYLLRMHLLLAHQKPASMDGSLTFDCSNCLTNFHSSKGLQQHHSTCGQKLHCVQCGDNFDGVKTLEQHAVKHDAAVLTCGECGEICTTVGILHCHYYRVHMGEPWCIKPHRRKTNRPPLKYFKDHSSKVWCVVDGKVVARTPDGRPVRDYGDKARICHVCGKAYRTQAHLELHMTLHDQKEMLQCDRCPKQFPHKARLKQHLRWHDSVAKTCPKCPAKLKSNLYNHMMIHHSDQKRHICDVCGKAFKTSTSVKIHIKTVHMKIKPPATRRRKTEKTKKTKAKTKAKNEDVVCKYMMEGSGDEEYGESEERLEYVKEESEERDVEESVDLEYECVVYDDCDSR